MSLAAKLAGVLGGVAVAAGLLAYYVVGYLIVEPPNVQADGFAPAGAADAPDGGVARLRAASGLGVVPGSEAGRGLGALER